METKIIEATQNAERGFNWGKFCVARFDTEWKHRSAIDPGSSLPLLTQRGWGREHLWVMDLETCEAVGVRPGGSAHADLEKHQVWVCPMFEPFLMWLYKQDLTDLGALPDLVELPDAPGAMSGYRRPGPGKDDLDQYIDEACESDPEFREAWGKVQARDQQD